MAPNTFDTEGRPGRNREHHDPKLRHQLNGFQILSIVLSAVIGSGVFNGNGEALAVAGPAGMLIAVALLGLVAAMVAETVGELVRLFPAPNAVFQYVYTFLDEDLAQVTAIAYWYCFAAVFANQLIGSANMLYTWSDASPTSGVSAYLFYGVIPTVLLLLNLLGVKWFGWVETVGGLLKSLIVLGVTGMMYRKAGTITHGEPLGSQPWSYRIDIPGKQRLLIALPGVAYGYVGIESIIVAAFEACPSSTDIQTLAQRTNSRSPSGPGPSLSKVKDIAWASTRVQWVILSLYLLYTLGVSLTLTGDNEDLPMIFGIHEDDTHARHGISTAIIVLRSMTDDARIIGFVLGSLIFCILSAANTSLYISSRTLWGLAHNSKGKRFKKLAYVWRETSVPIVALSLSLIAFSTWVPATQFTSFAAPASFILSSTASASCLLVWAVLCLTFIRYRFWTLRCGQGLLQLMQGRQTSQPATVSSTTEDRTHSSSIPMGLLRQRQTREINAEIAEQREQAIDLSFFIPRQKNYNKHVAGYFNRGSVPFAACIGFAGCILVFACALGNLWVDQTYTAVKVIAAYGAQSVFLSTYLLLKLVRKVANHESNWFLWTDKDPANPTILKDRLMDLIGQCETSRNRYESIHQTEERLGVRDSRQILEYHDQASGTREDARLLGP